MEICSSIQDQETAIIERVMYHLITWGTVLFLILLIGVSWKHLLLILIFFNENINGTV